MTKLEMAIAIVTNLYGLEKPADRDNSSVKRWRKLHIDELSKIYSKIKNNKIVFEKPIQKVLISISSFILIYTENGNHLALFESVPEAIHYLNTNRMSVTNKKVLYLWNNHLKNQLLY